MADVIVTDSNDGWNHVTVPNKGCVVFYPDGLLNVLDSKGRAMWTSYGEIKRVEYFVPGQTGFGMMGIPIGEEPKPTP